MDDETLVNCSKKRLRQLHIKNESLEQAAVRCISTNIQLYLKQVNNKEKIQDLPGVLRDKILQELLRRSYPDDKITFFKDEAFPVLLSPRTCSVALTNVFSSYLGPYQDVIHAYRVSQNPAFFVRNLVSQEVPKGLFEEFLASITSLAPNTRHLTLKKKYAFEIYTISERLEEKCLDYLIKMQHLQRLHVDLYYFEVYEVLQLCQNIASLKYLNVRLEPTEKKDYPSVADIRSCLANVKEFLFRSKGVRNNHNWLRVLCIRTLPKIEVVNFYCDRKWKKTDYFQFNINRRPVKMEFSGASNLRHLYVDLRGPEYEIESYPDVFPMVNHLTIRLDYPFSCCRRSLDSILKFQEIKSLTLIGEDHFFQHILDRILATYGQNLPKLIVVNNSPAHTKMKLNTISRNCPKLETLILYDVMVTVDNSQPIDVFAELKYLRLTMNSYFLPQVPLTNLWSGAPKLEKIVIHNSLSFRLEDLRAMTSLIRNGKVSTRLHTLQIHLRQIFPVSDKIFKEMTHLLNSAFQFLPNLINFDFVFPDYSNLGVIEEKEIFQYKYPFVIQEINQKTDVFDIFEK